MINTDDYLRYGVDSSEEDEIFNEEEFKAVCRNALISRGRIAPETKEERELWRKSMGRSYKSEKDLIL